MNAVSSQAKRVLPAMLAGVMAALGGCAAPGPAAPRVLEVQLDGDEAYQAFWLHAVRTVRLFGFEMDRADPTAGVISTLPATSKQWFEFWRNDTQGAYEVLESSLHTIQRDVRVRIEPAPQPEQYLVSVAAHVTRQNRPERQMTTPSAALQAFSDQLPTTSGRMTEGGEGIYSIPMGRDGRLEAAILARLARWPTAQIVLPSDQAPATPPAAGEPAAATQAGTDPAALPDAP